MHKRGALSRATVFNGALHRFEGFDKVRSVASLDVEIGEAFDQPGNVSSGSLYFDGDTDGIAVVFNKENYRQFKVACGIERFPEFAFAAGSVPEGDINNFVLVKTGNPVS